jgi:hypothetical protein
MHGRDRPAVAPRRGNQRLVTPRMPYRFAPAHRCRQRCARPCTQPVQARALIQTNLEIWSLSRARPLSRAAEIQSREAVPLIGR